MRNLSSIFFFLMGGLLLGAAFFAEVIGLDKDPGWGKGRIALLILGIMSISIAYYYYSNPFRLLVHRIPLFNFGSVRHQSDPSPKYRIQYYWFIFPALFFILLFYIWFVSSGRWNNWKSPTDYYAALAQAVLEGNLYLPIQPDPRLLALDNPYDPSERSGIETPADLSLYNGKFYMYWGPVPAIIPATIYISTGRRMGDMALALVFACGMLLVQSLILLTIWNHYFRTLPEWALHITILLCGLTGPLTLLRHNYDNARIYEASIAGGQFFLLGGFLMALTAMIRNHIPGWRLVMAGILWAMAIGTRQLLVVPIGFITFLIALLLIKTNMSVTTKIWKCISLGTPLVLGFAGLSWYNWARFGSITETGLYYQLADPNLREHYSELFSLAYSAQNFYNFLFNPIELLPKFPFVFMHKGLETSILPIYTVPEFYTAQPIAGLVYLIPFVIFAAISFIRLFPNPFKDKKFQENPTDDNPQRLVWISLSMGSSALIAFSLSTTFFWVGMRYAGDFIPALSIFSCIGFWQGIQLMERDPLARRLYAFAGVILAGTSIASSILLAISTNSRLVNFLTRVFPVLR